MMLDFINLIRGFMQKIFSILKERELIFLSEVVLNKDHAADLISFTAILAGLFSILGAFAYTWMFDRGFKLRNTISGEYHCLREMLNLCVCEPGEHDEIKKERKRTLEFIIRYMAKKSDSLDIPIRIKRADISAQSQLLEDIESSKQRKNLKKLIDQVNSMKDKLADLHSNTRAIFEAKFEYLLVLLPLGLLYIPLVIFYEFNIVIFLLGYIFFAGLIDLQYLRTGYYSTTMHKRLRWMYYRLITHQANKCLKDDYIKYKEKKEKLFGLLNSVNLVIEEYKSNIRTMGEGFITDKNRRKIDESCENFVNSFDLPQNKANSFVETLDGTEWKVAQEEINKIENLDLSIFGFKRPCKTKTLWKLFLIIVLILFFVNYFWLNEVVLNVIILIIGLALLQLTVLRPFGVEGYFSNKLEKALITKFDEAEQKHLSSLKIESRKVELELCYFDKKPDRYK